MDYAFPEIIMKFSLGGFGLHSTVCLVRKTGNFNNNIVKMKILLKLEMRKFNIAIITYFLNLDKTDDKMTIF